MGELGRYVPPFVFELDNIGDMFASKAARTIEDAGQLLHPGGHVSSRHVSSPQREYHG